MGHSLVNFIEDEAQEQFKNSSKIFIQQSASNKRQFQFQSLNFVTGTRYNPQNLPQHKR